MFHYLRQPADGYEVMKGDLPTILLHLYSALNDLTKELTQLQKSTQLHKTI